MKTARIIVSSILLLYCFSQAKNTYSVISVGLAVPLSSAAPIWGPNDTGVLVHIGDKNLNMGWEGSLTFFGLPFTKFENALSGLAFGGKISYNRWKRDSTMQECTFLGTEGIVRYYLPVKINRFAFFGQVGGGMFIGEHGFNDMDTVPASPPPSGGVTLVTEGQKDFGASFNIGINWDVIEFSPGVTMVFTSGKPSAWFSLNAAAKF
ncbi:MAG: hypothetical protein JW913_10235 [Chitinispirillaceae bacterium]|nr:hypothetical protein [Chitinispirillaceae bacterium]